MWTKIIRNKTAVEYLFNAESYQFNYQFENRLPKRIQLYPVDIKMIIFFFSSDFFYSVKGDEFATRCIYNTMNKDEITLVKFLFFILIN
jgi:hypothetical protein